MEKRVRGRLRVKTWMSKRCLCLYNIFEFNLKLLQYEILKKLVTFIILSDKNVTFMNDNGFECEHEVDDTKQNNGKMHCLAKIIAY